MKNYEKPIILTNEDLAEGVYAASGSNCYSVNAIITQTPQDGRGDYRIQLNGSHAALNNHHSTEQILSITFNQPVTYSWSTGVLIGGNGTNTLKVSYGHHNNGNDNIGLGDLIIVSDINLMIASVSLDCNQFCGQH